ADRVVATFDGYAAAWVAMRAEVCAARQSPTLVDLRAQCLDRRRNGLRELAALFSDRPDGAVVDKAAGAARRLEDLAACAEAQALLAGVPLRAGAAARARVAALRGRLDRAMAMLEAGRYRDGNALATMLVAEAATIDYAPTVAEALYVAAGYAQN